MALRARRRVQKLCRAPGEAALLGVDAPERDDADTDGGDHCLHGRPCEGEDSTRMYGLRSQRVAAAPIPQHKRVLAVGADGCKALATGREGQATDAYGVSTRERHDWIGVVELPHANLCAPAARLPAREQSTRGMQGEAAQLGVVPA